MKSDSESRYARPPAQHVKIEPYQMGACDPGQRKTHPAFGMIQFSRSSGGGDQKFFGSEVSNCGTTFTVRITRGKQIWNLHDSRFFGDSTPLVEADLTAAQFVQLLTTMNQGSGVPCTLRRAHLNSGHPDIVPGIIDEQTTHQLMREDLKAGAAKILDQMTNLLSNLTATLADSSVPKKKKEDLVRQTEHVQMQLRENMPFLVDQYQQALDKQKTAHLAEVDAAITGMIHSLGVKSLGQLLEAEKLTTATSTQTEAELRTSGIGLKIHGTTASPSIDQPRA